MSFSHIQKTTARSKSAVLQRAARGIGATIGSGAPSLRTASWLPISNIFLWAGLRFPARRRRPHPYGPEKILECFYTAQLWRGFSRLSFDLQHINNPGYNQVRGPVTVPTLRFHAEF